MKWFSFMVFLAGFSLLSMQPSAAGDGDIDSAQASSWDFTVYLDDTPIGYHKFVIERQHDDVSVHTMAEFDVRFLFIPVYSYQHENSESWKNGCLIEIRSSTDDNGDDYFITSRQTGDTISLSTSNGESNLDGCIRSYAYWDIDLLDADQLLNTQTGQYQKVKLEDLGETTYKLGDTSIRARQYRLLNDDAAITLWYTQDRHWLALESEMESGSVLRYVPKNPQQFIKETAS